MKKRDELFTIAELVRKSNVKRGTVGNYIKLGLVPIVSTNKQGQCLYDKSSVQRVKLIKRLAMGGYKLSEIGEMLEKFLWKIWIKRKKLNLHGSFVNG